jgi:small subunit ribosomal protein S3Ae
MAIGKNKKGRKGRKKIIEPMSRKDWYDVQVPSTFAARRIGKTLVNRTSGLKTSTDALIGRVFEANLADLNKDESVSFRKMKFICEEVQGFTLLTNFHGMDLTRDKLCSLVKKWHTLIEAWCDVKTTDGYVLRLFCIGFTKRRHKQVSKTSYAQGGHVRAIRKKMIQIMTAKASASDFNKLISEFIPESIGQDIMVACNSIYPLSNVFIRKCKVLRKPKFDLQRLLEVHQGGAAGAAADVEEDALVEELEGTGGRL